MPSSLYAQAMQVMRDSIGLTPFLQAVAAWNYPESRRLLTQGADVNETVFGMTPLDLARQCQKENLFELLGITGN
jgi:hypothetical protein